ncbi:hypothetical protein [Cupriavidus pinatubonensis]|uniref:hypothetical protein n=1 Tax=Cupriavidus pinatubonensis TaxID=248026 RepID=UPI003615C6F5
MTRTINLRNIVIDALLTGGDLCASTFAKERGLVAESVSRALRDLGRYLEKVKEPGKAGRIYYRAVDIASLRRIRSEKRIGTNQYSNPVAVSTMRFSELLDAWGIQLVDLDLPRTTHTMHDEPEAAQV